MESDLKNININFRAPSAALVLCCVLMGELLDDRLVATFLDSSWGDLVLSGIAGDENAIAAKKASFGGTLGTMLMFVITAGVLKAYFPLHSFRELFARFGLLPFANARPVLASLAAGIALVLLFRYVLQDAFPPPERAAIHPANIINSGSTADKLVFVFGAAMLAPVAEEFLFRGVLYDGVSSSSNKPVAAVLVTVAFIFLHPATVSTGYWLTHALLYVTACLLMLIREMTGGLPAPIAFHAGVNGASLLL